jgi:N-acetylmuramoyl-L-alanine amidase
MLKKIIFGSFLTLIYITLISFANKIDYNNHLHTIILDAGHGGKDPGASCYNNECTEAEITLGITLKLGKEIEQLLPHVKVYYTRKDDSYPSLYYRADFANEKQGDLFVSIHCNSTSGGYKKVANGTKTITVTTGKGKKKKTTTKEVTVYKTIKIGSSAKGMETFIWIPSKNEQKTDAIAARENAEIFKDPDYKKNYGNGVDINSAEFIAKAKLRTKKYFMRSTMLANFVQEEGANAGRNDRNIRQRGVGIWVLQATAMPSVLVETGYISTPEEKDYLNSNNGQKEMAEIIAKAIKKYNDDLNKSNTTNNNKSFNTIKNNSYVFIRKPKQVTLARAIA